MITASQFRFPLSAESPGSRLGELNKSLTFWVPVSNPWDPVGCIQEKELGLSQGTHGVGQRLPCRRRIQADMVGLGAVVQRDPGGSFQGVLTPRFTHSGNVGGDRSTVTL